MRKASVLLAFSAVFLINQLTAQTSCSALGQNASTAFPVCGSTDFAQSTVPICGGRQVPVPCSETVFTDVNPYWYRFTCYVGGTLGFEITPNNLADDYDWQLFDITGRNVEDVYTDDALFVACNWSGYGGITGASNEGTSLVSCSGDNPIWSSMPTLVAGHEYLLLVSHFTQSQSGYTLSFKGGTAEISDRAPSSLQLSDGYCTGNSLYVKLDKPIKCTSIAADGSDFSVSGTSVPVVGASSPACLANFVTDSVIVQLGSTVSQGHYQVSVRDGSDGNSLLNICDINMAPATTTFRMYESVSAEFAHNIRTGCEVDTIDFSHDGARNVNKWQWLIDGQSWDLQQLALMFGQTGDKAVSLVVSNDFCSDTAEAVINLPAKIDASFAGPSIICAKDPAIFTDQSTGNIVAYSWNFGNNRTSNSPNPPEFNFPFNTGEVKQRVTLAVTDADGCVDSAAADVVVVGNCNIVVPSAFTPNRDGRNDELYPTNAFNADDLVFRVFNRYGRIVFESHDWQKRWDGRVNGIMQPAGTYVWTLSYKLKTTGTPYFFKGTTTLLR